MTCLKTIIAGICIAIVPDIVSAQDRSTIADRLNDSTSVTVIQPNQLNLRLVRVDSEGPAVEQQSEENRVQTGKTAGYRVQVFSDNNPRTSKNEARTKERAVAAMFPQFATYVTYNSPYWRLKVGDFTTMPEAEAAADELKKQFPSYAREIRVVRDRINVFK